MTPANSYQMLIAGNWCEAVSGARFSRLNPADDQLAGTYPEAAMDDVELAVSAARRAFDDGPWPQLSGAERALILHKIAAGIRTNVDMLAAIESNESGKPISQARNEMGWAAGIWDYAAALSRTLHGETVNTLGPQKLGLVLREPIGVVALITPWNFPLLILSQKLPFALAAGCTCVVKPSEFTSGTSLRLGRIMQEAGVPAGVVNLVTGYGEPVGAGLSQHGEIDMISFTGSTAVGKQIVAGSAGNLKKVALELGGKNPQLVFADADLDAAVDAVVFGVYFNMGECCNSGSRLLVEETIADDFIERVIARSRDIVMGDPREEKTKVGAIINDRQMEKIRSYVASAREAGAEVRLGGEPLVCPSGRYFLPTLIDHVKPEMTIAREEVFGPVLSIIRFRTEAEAVKIANHTAYGLSAGVWTANLTRALTLGRSIRAGTVWLNCFMDGFPELGFGGYKQSGLGRELGGAAVEEYTETKTLTVQTSPHGAHWWMPSKNVS